MVAGQTMVASDGYEVMLFPLPYMYISQCEGGSTSHDGTLNIDFIGWSASGRVYDAPLYAPCSIKCVATISPTNNGRIFESLNLVHTPNGLEYVCFMTMHDENPIASVGDTFIQGEIFGHTGTYGDVTGDHVHLNCANGQYTGYHTVNGHTVLNNSEHIYNICYVNDTVLYRPLTYNWLFYQFNPLYIGWKKFPWVLYARKLREQKSY